MDNGAIVQPPGRLSGMENRVLVFNSDFVSENLQWERGIANAIFYLSKDQADQVSRLAQLEQSLPAKTALRDGATQTALASKRAFATYCTERAKVVHGARHLGSRKYEAPKLKADYATQKFDGSSILDPHALAAKQEVLRRAAPLPPLSRIEIDFRGLESAIGQAIEFAGMSLGSVVLAELERHPRMVSWIKTGHQYHVEQRLDTCLLCLSPFSSDRKAQLAQAFDEKLTRLIAEATTTRNRAQELRRHIEATLSRLPRDVELEPVVRYGYAEARRAVEQAATATESMLDDALAALAARLERPTYVETSLSSMATVADVLLAFKEALERLNALIGEHNAAANDFTGRQDEASAAILRHYLAEGLENYQAAKASAEADAKLEAIAADELKAVQDAISELKAEVRAHGPAAAKITSLVGRYLGHKELSIVATEQGYSLHRHGRPVKGQPSEGEKTAIALCYFLTTIEAENRALKDLIVIVDDPISSLDTRAMNYACAMILSAMHEVGQLFVLTHNHHCMNEFKKAWKGKAYPRDKSKPPSGCLLYMDVRSPNQGGARSTTIVEMSPLLREHDSEYHFLCSQLLEFEAAGSDHSPKLLLMPNVMRRILEIFLAFKVPGTAPIKDKLRALTKRHSELDPVRIAALERLSQVESHSDNLNDLVEHSPMIVEEVRQTCGALLELMMAADASHTSAIRSQCKAG